MAPVHGTRNLLKDIRQGEEGASSSTGTVSETETRIRSGNARMSIKHCTLFLRQTTVSVGLVAIGMASVS